MCVRVFVVFFPFFKLFQKSILPFPDFDSLAAWTVLEQELIELRNTIFLPC